MSNDDERSVYKLRYRSVLLLSAPRHLSNHHHLSNHIKSSGYVQCSGLLSSDWSNHSDHSGHSDHHGGLWRLQHAAVIRSTLPKTVTSVCWRTAGLK